jgi:hypothetical protein
MVASRELNTYNITVFRIDQQTGKLSFTGTQVQIGAPRVREIHFRIFLTRKFAREALRHSANSSFPLSRCGNDF